MKKKVNKPISSIELEQEQLTLGLLHNFIMYAGFAALRMSIMRECSGPEEAKELFDKIVDSWATVTKTSITVEAERMHSNSREPFHQLLTQMLGDLNQKQDVEDIHVAHVKAVNTVVSKVKEMIKWEDNEDENH